MQSNRMIPMDSKTVMFSVLVLAAVFAFAVPMDSVYAQTSDVMPNGEGEEGEGKSCPFKGAKMTVQFPNLF